MSVQTSRSTRAEIQEAFVRFSGVTKTDRKRVNRKLCGGSGGAGVRRCRLILGLQIAGEGLGADPD